MVNTLQSGVVTTYSANAGLKYWPTNLTNIYRGFTLIFFTDYVSVTEVIRRQNFVSGWRLTWPVSI